MGPEKHSTRRTVRLVLATALILVLSAGLIAASEAATEVYTVIYDAGEGSGSMPPGTTTSVRLGDMYTYPECGFDPPAGRKFSHWEMSGADRYGLPGNEEKIVEKCVSGGIVTVYCRWSAGTFDEAVVDTRPAGKDLTYNGSAQKLVTAGSSSTGTMMYTLGENNTDAPDFSAFSVNIPTGKKAGDYYVWFMAAGDSSHANSGKGVIKVTIKPASNPTPTPKPRKKVPRTGDDSMPGLWLGLVLLGTACISGVLVRTARKRK